MEFSRIGTGESALYDDSLGACGSAEVAALEVRHVSGARSGVVPATQGLP